MIHLEISGAGSRADTRLNVSRNPRTGLVKLKVDARHVRALLNLPRGVARSLGVQLLEAANAPHHERTGGNAAAIDANLQDGDEIRTNSGKRLRWQETRPGWGFFVPVEEGR